MKILNIIVIISFFFILNQNGSDLLAEIPEQLIEQDKCVSCHLEILLNPRQRSLNSK